MLAGIVVVLVLFNSYSIYSIDNSTYANSNEVIPAISMKTTEMAMFETILKNLPSNRTNHRSPRVTKNSVGICLSDLMQIQAQLQNLDVNALQSKSAEVSLISAYLNNIIETETNATVIDAWGKLPSGMLTGNAYEFGSFDECFDVQLKRRNTNEFIRPQYCLAKVYVLHGKQTITNSMSENKQTFRVDGFNIFRRMSILQE